MYLCTLALASLAWLASGSSRPMPPRDPLGQEADGVESSAPLRYARVASDRASVRNLQSDSGLELLAPPPGTLVAVHREHAEWMEVELPGGFAVWVYGKYLKPTEQPDVLEVTRNAVNMRPLPKSDVNSFPLPQRLHSGDRVRKIEQEDPARPLEDSWVRIWSPPGVRAYLRTSAVSPLSPSEDGAALFREALAKGPVPLPARAASGGASAPDAPAGSAPRDEAGQDPSEVHAALLAAREAFDRELSREAPDFAAVTAAWNAVLALEPAGPVAAEARHQLDLVAFYEASAALRSDLERARASGAEGFDRERAAIEARSRSKDPLGAAFLSRGVLVRQVSVDGTPHYFLRFGGELVSELVCPSGRYDLDVFAGYEIGVNGGVLPAHDLDRPAIEVRRLEVIQRR
jgi:hypothetical protein